MNLGKHLLLNATAVWIALVTLVIVYYVARTYGGPLGQKFASTAQRLSTPGSN